MRFAKEKQKKLYAFLDIYLYSKEHLWRDDRLKQIQELIVY